MGASPYWYFVPYREDFNSALLELKQKEFAAGRYNPVVMFPEFPVTDSTVSAGAQHSSIEEAAEDAMEDGTRSILDLNEVSETDDYCVARILSPQELLKYFGTEKPEKQQVENNFQLFEDVERGKGFCIVVHQNQKPAELFFVGYSFD